MCFGVPRTSKTTIFGYILEIPTFWFWWGFWPPLLYHLRLWCRKLWYMNLWCMYPWCMYPWYLEISSLDGNPKWGFPSSALTRWFVICCIFLTCRQHCSWPPAKLCYQETESCGLFEGNGAPSKRERKIISFTLASTWAHARAAIFGSTKDYRDSS